MNYSNKIYLLKNKALLTQKLFIIIFCIIIGPLFSILIYFNWKYSAIIPAIILLLYLLKTPKVTYILAILTSVFFTFVRSLTFSLSGLTIGLNPYKILIIILFIGLLLRFLLHQRLAIKQNINIRVFSKIIILWWTVVAFSTIITPIIDGGFVPYYLNSIKDMVSWTLVLIALIISLYSFSWRERDLKIYINILIILVVSIAIYFIFKKDILFNSNLTLTSSKAYVMWAEVAKNQIPEIFTLVSILNISIGIQEKMFSKRIIRIIFSIIMIISIFYFFSRESIITLSVGTIVLFLFSRINLNKKIILIGIAIIVIVVFFKSSFGDYIIQTVKTFSLSSPESASYRVERWMNAIKICCKYPLTGVGFSGYRYFSNFSGGAAHNGFLQAWVISGFPGFIVYCLVLFQSYKILKSTSLSIKLGSFTQACSRGLLSVFIGYMVSNLVSDHFFSFGVFNMLFWGTFAIVNKILIVNKNI